MGIIPLPENKTKTGFIFSSFLHFQLSIEKKGLSYVYSNINMYIYINIYIYIYTIHVYLYQPGWFFRRLFNHKQKKHTKTHTARLSSNMTSNVSVSFTISPWKWFSKHPGYRRDPRGPEGELRLDCTQQHHNNLCINIYIYMNINIHNTKTLCLGFILMLAWCWTCFRWVHGAEYHFGFMSLARWQIFEVAWQIFLWWQGFVWRCFFGTASYEY